MHSERKPSLEPCVPQTVVRIEVIVIVMQAFTWLATYLELLGLFVTPHLDDLARLNTAQNRDQPVLALLLRCHV